MDYEQLNKILVTFTTNFNNLSSNVVNAARGIKDSADRIELVVKNSTDSLTRVLSDFDKHIVDYSKSSNRQALAMMILTGALVLVGLLQIFVH
jgi:hypothetical protein